MKRSPRQALHTRFSPKMEIRRSKNKKPEASSMLMLPKQGIFGTLTSGISKVNNALNKASEVHQQATQVYNKGRELQRQVYSQIPQPYPQQPQMFSQPPQPYPQQPQVYISQPPQPYPQQPKQRVKRRSRH